MPLSKQERMAIYFERLESAEPCSTEMEAYALVCRALDEVEDEFSGVVKSNEPGPRPADGRMYPPQADNRYVTDRPGVVRYRTAGHNVFIRANGAIEVSEARGAKVKVFEKPGQDGRLVGDP